MTGSIKGPVLHGASVLIFLAGLTSLLVSLGQLTSKREDDSSGSRRRFVRSLDRLNPEDVESLYRHGIFSALINASMENTRNEALLVLLPALEKFENVMVEESRKVREALKDHDQRIQYLEDFISRQGDKDVQNTQGIHPNKIEQRKARIKVTKSKAQNEVLKSAIKRKEIILKEILKKPPVDVEIVRNETYLLTVQNDTDIVNDVKEVKTVSLLNETLLMNETLTRNHPLSSKDILLKNETLSINDTVMTNDTAMKNDNVFQNESLESIEAEVVKGILEKNSSQVLNDTEVKANSSDNGVLRDSSAVNNTSQDNNSGVNNTTLSTSNSQGLVEITDYTTMGILSTSTASPLTVSMTTTSTISPTTNPPSDIKSLEKTVSELQVKVNQLEKVRSNSGRGKSHNFKKKMKILEKNLAEIKKRYRKMKSRLNSHNSKISGLEILQNVAYMEMPRDVMKEYEAKKATILRFDRIERKLTNYRDMVIRNRQEIRDLKGQTSKHEHYISELQAGSDRFEHKGRELTVSMHGVEANMGNLFNSLNGYMSDIRWEIRVMLDRVCGDNRLHC